MIQNGTDTNKYEHLRQLRKKYAFKLKIKYTMLISSKGPI